MSAPVRKSPAPDISFELIDAIKSFPTHRDVSHCGLTFQVPSLAIYGTCPTCGSRIKVRSFAAVPELEDLFDAMLEWTLSPEARRVAEERQRAIAEDE